MFLCLMKNVRHGHWVGSGLRSTYVRYMIYIRPWEHCGQRLRPTLLKYRHLQWQVDSLWMNYQIYSFSRLYTGRQYLSYNLTPRKLAMLRRACCNVRFVTLIPKFCADAVHCWPVGIIRMEILGDGGTYVWNLPNPHATWDWVLPIFARQLGHGGPEDVHVCLRCCW